MSRDQHAGQNHNIEMGNTFFESVSKFIHLETSVANPNCIMNKLRVGIFASIWRRIFCLSVCYQKI